MDYIFKDWEQRLTAFANSVEKDLEEIRKCKAEIQQMKLEVTAEVQKGRYLRDDHRLVLSAPEIVIGNVDRNGTLFSGGSDIVMRGTNVGVEAASEGGVLVLRAPNIRQIAEDPGVDGEEHVVYQHSEVMSQARNIIIQSDEATGAFFEPALPTGGSGVRIHADQKLEVEAAMTAESREQLLDDRVKAAEDNKNVLKELADKQKEGFKKSVEEIQKLIEEKEKLSEDLTAVRTNTVEIRELDREIRELSASIASHVYDYSNVLSQLAEANRQIKCFKEQKDKVVKGEDFKTNSTGAVVAIKGENISLTSADGENNLRDNEGSGIAITANKVGIASVEENGKLKEKGKVSVKAMNIEVATAGETDQQYEKGVLKSATYTAEGDFTLKSKNITIEGVDDEMAEKKLKEKQLTPDSKIKLRAKTIEVSTEASANVEVDDQGQLTKANYTAEGDIIVKSKTFTLETVDSDFENGQAQEKELTKESKVVIRAEKMELMTTDKEGKLVEGSAMKLASEEMSLGAVSDDVKSKKLQAVSEEMELKAEKTFKTQQGEGKAVIQLEGDNADVTGEKITAKGETTIEGNTTIKGKTDIKDALTAPKATIDNVDAKSSFKSPNISDGVATA